MELYGFQSLTLLDYPGHIAATLFTGGCNYRCPFCQNGDLIHPSDPLSMESVLAKLAKRRRMIEGVCISGGEPTLHRNLPQLIRSIREMGLLVKLDTNGTNPSMVKELVSEGLLDYLAMDIKNSPEQYGSTAGVLDPSLDSVRETVDFLMSGNLPFEFRTTLVPELHTPEDMEAIGLWLEGAPAYFLQAYRESEAVIAPIYTEPKREWMEEMRRIVLPRIPNTQIRGID